MGVLLKVNFDLVPDFLQHFRALFLLARLVVLGCRNWQVLVQDPLQQVGACSLCDRDQQVRKQVRASGRRLQKVRLAELGQLVAKVREVVCCHLMIGFGLVSGGSCGNI